MEIELKRDLIEACRPDEAIGPDDRRHYDFDHPTQLRGSPWRDRLAEVIELSRQPTAQLVTGLRGSGKTTELRQLDKVLSERGHCVIMADVGRWISNERAITTTDLMLATVLAVYPRGQPETKSGWLDEYKEQLANFLFSKVKLDGKYGEGAASMVVGLTTDETVFQRAADQLRKLDGLRDEIHGLLARAASRSLAEGRRLILLLDGAEKRALGLGDISDANRSLALHSAWFDAFTIEAINLRPPVDVIYTVPPFMIRRSAQLAAAFGQELEFLPMIRVYERSGRRYAPGIEAVAQALFRRVPQGLFADPAIPRWLVSRCGGYFRDLLRFVTEMIYRVGDAPIFTREIAEAAVGRIQQQYFEALVAEEKQILAELHPSKRFPDEEAARLRMDALLQEFKMVRYHNGDPWFDAHPLCWPAIDAGGDLPTWEDIESLP
ncbi:hypothetical protein ACNOYE_11680 [Nannocystaceae bacterium ST9]